jgi:hypothetical protein
MTKKIKDDSDSDKKPKKKTKAKKKTTKKKDNKGITINVNVGTGGNNNKKSRKGGKNKNKNVLNTTAPANIRPISYNSSLVSGYIDKNDAKDIEKLQNKLTTQDDNIIRGVESLKTLQNKLIKLENTPNKEIVYIQSPNAPVSAIKEGKRKPGRPKKTYKVEYPKESKPRGRPPKAKTNLSDKFEEVITPKKKNKVGRPKKVSIQPDPVKVSIPDNLQTIPQFSFSDSTESFFKPGDNGDDDNIFNYTADIPIEIRQAQGQKKINKNTKTYIKQQYRKYDENDLDFDSDWRSYLDDNDIYPDEVKGMNQNDTVNYVYNRINGIIPPPPPTPPATATPDEETTFDYGETFSKDPNDEIKSTGTNILKNNSGGSITLNKPPENYDSLLDSIRGRKPLQYDETTNKVTTRSQAKKHPMSDAIKENPIKLKKAHTKTKEDKLKDIALENLKNNPLLQNAASRRSKIEDDNSDDDNDPLQWV